MGNYQAGPPAIIVGAPNLLTWYPTVVLRCSCSKTDANLAIIIGWGNQSPCGICGRMFILGPGPNEDGSLPITWVNPTKM